MQIDDSNDYKGIHDLKARAQRTQNMMLRVRGRGGGGADDPPAPDTIASCEPYPDLVEDALDRRHLVDVSRASASRPDTERDAAD